MLLAAVCDSGQQYSALCSRFNKPRCGSEAAQSLLQWTQESSTICPSVTLFSGVSLMALECPCLGCNVSNKSRAERERKRQIEMQDTQHVHISMQGKQQIKAWIQHRQVLAVNPSSQSEKPCWNIVSCPFYHMKEYAVCLQD